MNHQDYTDHLIYQAQLAHANIAQATQRALQSAPFYQKVYKFLEVRFQGNANLSWYFRPPKTPSIVLTINSPLSVTSGNDLSELIDVQNDDFFVTAEQPNQFVFIEKLPVDSERFSRRVRLDISEHH
ncbi:hypothetical protein [Neisseria sp. Ec49-e6-T10]|uniref:hypothetical protein n=1 Tax=Neisseria sp. Ec49-e6-T10 TaxID=3140744 RepID=UPI003EC0ED1C